MLTHRRHPLATRHPLRLGFFVVRTWQRLPAHDARLATLLIASVAAMQCTVGGAADGRSRKSAVLEESTEDLGGVLLRPVGQTKRIADDLARAASLKSRWRQVQAVRRQRANSTPQYIHNRLGKAQLLSVSGWDGRFRLSLPHDLITHLGSGGI